MPGLASRSDELVCRRLQEQKDDKSLLAQFFFADEALNMIASELDSFDGRKDPERCSALVNQLRQSQDKVLTITNAIMEDLIGNERANRDFRVKFPEDVLQENLAGQLWFGAECLAAGSSIMNREAESAAMRPLAKALTKSLEHVRILLRDTCLRSNQPNGPLKLNGNELVTDTLLESLKIFDGLFADFELRYVSAMVPVKTTLEYILQEMIGVLFSETLQRALKMKLLTQDMVDSCDPALMFTIPRLAIVSGLLVFPNGPLCIDKPADDMSEMFKPFRTLLRKIRELLWTLDKKELYTLEKVLCDNNEQPGSFEVSECNINEDFLQDFYNNPLICKDYFNDNLGIKKRVKKNEPEKNSIYTYHDIEETEERPSTSGYLISNTVDHDSIVASISSHNQEPLKESLPDNDSLEVITEAAATLNSILTTEIKDSKKKKPTKSKKRDKLQPESPDDSGICTENTSLDRSPTLDSNETKCCVCVADTSKIYLCGYADTETNNGTNDKVVKTYRGQVSPSTSRSSKEDGHKNGSCLNLDSTRLSEDDSSSVASSDTSSFNSNSADDEEIAMAMQAAEITNRNEIRSQFKSSEDLIHRLYVCIAGVADQLQTNFASDLRNILKYVFLMNVSNEPEKPVETEASIEYHPTETEVIENEEFSVDPNILAQEALFDSNVYFHINGDHYEHNGETEYTNYPREQTRNRTSETTLNGHTRRDAPQEIERPPIWIPDVEAPKCMSCGSNFTVVKRRHHCRNCGKVFCSRCSSNNVPLPKFGHTKPVRVCNKCFLYHLTPFTM
ncbi:early endosome antigen 1 [Holotrichia oblita]|uniref:Early endosome antigen 1 n=1 Tax=Holotrichia oblita TaxID=644536 RepID=A0ACB9T1Q0_HOLOL|nr:early endosome antigen 1 [Holotrichia oblita]